MKKKGSCLCGAVAEEDRLECRDVVGVSVQMTFGAVGTGEKNGKE